jgi:hypothetical protein
MGIKRVVVLIAVMSLLVIGTVSPTPARAADAAEITVLVCVSIAAYVALVFIGTALTHRSPQAWAEVPADFQVDGKQPPAAMRFGPKCRQSSTALTLVCW